MIEVLEFAAFKAFSCRRIQENRKVLHDCRTSEIFDLGG